MQIWEMRPEYFDGRSGPREISYAGASVTVQVDRRGRFELSELPPDLPLIGVFAKFIGNR